MVSAQATPVPRLSGKASTIRYALTKRFRDAQIEPLGAHHMQGSGATALLSAGAALSVVARILGHASLTRTMLYNKRSEEALDIPYYGK